MRVVYSGTRNLYPYIVASVKSLVAHNDVEKIYLLIEDDVFPYELPDVCEIMNISGQTVFPKNGANFRTSFTYMALMRVCYASLFPDIDRIIQLDVDTIVTDSLEEIWRVDLTGKWFGMVVEYLSDYSIFGKGKGINYNAGVSVFNLAEIRKDGIEQKLIDYLNTVECKFIDQDAWNYFGIPAKKAVDLPVRYNECFVTGYTANPAVVHYAGHKDWTTNRTIYRREYLDKYLDLKTRYMVHTCNDREWYVKDYLLPSLIDAGIDKKDITVWHDKKGIGNLASFVASCEWIAKEYEPYCFTWHLQDDVCISSRFFTETQKLYPGIASGFCNEIFDGERTNYIGVTSANGMWFSFQCIMIPNHLAADFAKWFREDCVPNNLFEDYVKSGKCDDSLFREYTMANKPKIVAQNIYPCIVDHVDYLIGGTVINKQREGVRKAYWRDKYLDKAVKDLEERLKERCEKS